MICQKFQIFILFLSLHITLYGQVPCSELKQLVPANRKVYMIGEVHLDQEIPITENVQMIKKVTEAEDSIREYLVKYCGVNHFMLELPNCYGYAIREYMSSGDTGWIQSLEQNPYYYLRLQGLRKLNEKYGDLRVTCVDINFPKDANRTIFALLTLTFYDHYSILYSPPYNTVTAVPPSADMNVALQIMRSDTVNITENMRNYFIDLIKLALLGDEAADQFYQLLLKTKADQKLLMALEKFYGDGWWEVITVMDSYIFGFKYKSITGEMLTDREPEYYKLVGNLMNFFKNDVYCMQFGDAHLYPDPKNNMVRKRIIDNYKYQPYCLHLIPQTFAFRLQEINKLDKPYDFNFNNKFCIYSTGESDAQVLVK